MGGISETEEAEAEAEGGPSVEKAEVVLEWSGMGGEAAAVSVEEGEVEREG